MVSNKLDRLIAILAEMRSLVVACSGGLDSVFLMHAASLCPARALAITTVSETTPGRDVGDAREAAARAGIEHRVLPSAEMSDPAFTANTPDRCYHCKRALFQTLWEIARAGGYLHVADGATLDDLGDFRPGMRAAEELGVRHPLIEAGYAKDGIRRDAQALGLAVWDKPASPCLSSRLAYGVRVTPEALARVARAEDYLRQRLGVRALRVRDHGQGLARIELPAECIAGAASIGPEIARELRRMGFAYVSLDLFGLTSGSMNLGLPG